MSARRGLYQSVFSGMEVFRTEQYSGYHATAPGNLRLMGWHEEGNYRQAQ